MTEAMIAIPVGTPTDPVTLTLEPGLTLPLLFVGGSLIVIVIFAGVIRVKKKKVRSRITSTFQ